MKKNNVLTSLMTGLIAMCAISLFPVFDAFSQEQTELTIKRSFSDMRDKDKVVVGVQGVATTGDVARLDKRIDTTGTNVFNEVTNQVIRLNARIDAEAQSRSNEVTRLDGRIDSEALARGEQDTKHSNLITSLQKSLRTEATRLDSKIDNKSTIVSPTADFYGRIENLPIPAYSSEGDEYLYGHSSLVSDGHIGYSANMPTFNCVIMVNDIVGPFVYHIPGSTKSDDGSQQGAMMLAVNTHYTKKTGAVSNYITGQEEEPYEGYLSAIYRYETKIRAMDWGNGVPYMPILIDFNANNTVGAREIRNCVIDPSVSWREFYIDNGSFAVMVRNMQIDYIDTYSGVINVGYEYLDYNNAVMDEATGDYQWQSGLMAVTFYDNMTNFGNALKQNDYSYGYEELGKADSFLTESKVGDVVDSYLDSANTARSRLVERTGQKNERGTGWGYILYDFASDVRRWELKVPRVNVAWGGSLNTDVGPYVTLTNTVSGEVSRMWVITPANVIVAAMSAGLSVNKELVKTEGKYGTDMCESVDLGLEMMPTDGDNADSPKMLSIDMTDTTRNQLGEMQNLKYDFSKFTFPEVVWSRSLGSNIGTSRVERILGCYIQSTGDTIDAPPKNTIIIRTEVLTKQCTKSSSGWQIPNIIHTNETPIVFSVNSTGSETLQCLYARLVNSNTSKWIYDEAKDVTWAINVTNGCFFTEIVGEGNLHEAENTY